VYCAKAKIERKCSNEHELLLCCRRSRTQTPAYAGRKLLLLTMVLPHTPRTAAAAGGDAAAAAAAALNRRLSDKC
jgi:hypothetical protein